MRATTAITIAIDGAANLFYKLTLSCLAEGVFRKAFQTTEAGAAGPAGGYANRTRGDFGIPYGHDDPYGGRRKAWER
jgi:hypothetical protein